MLIKIIPIPSEALLPTADKPINAITKKTQGLGVDKSNEGIFCSSLIVKNGVFKKGIQMLKKGIIGGRHVGGVGGRRQSLLAEVVDFADSRLGNMGSGVVMEKKGASAMDECWTFPSQFPLHFCQFKAVFVGIDCLTTFEEVVMDNASR